MIKYDAMMIERLAKAIKKLPNSPGIYIFKNSQNNPLYIGKSLNLRNRTRSYLNTNDVRLKKMINEANKLNFIKTDSDIESLLLESQYIKKHNPPFNIKLRDDKQYFYVGFGSDDFSKIFITHQPKNVSSISYLVFRRKNRTVIQNTRYNIQDTHIGPFTDGNALKTTLRLLRRIFPYCTCRQKHNNYCLNYHLDNCLGLCCLKLKSKNEKVKTTIKNSKLKLYQNNIKAIKGVLLGKKDSIIRQFKKEMKKLAEKEKFEEAIKLQYKIEKLKRIFRNAQIIQDTKYEIRNTKKEKAVSNTLNQLAKIVNAKHPLRRIEAYDIANIQGKHAVGAMVVFENGQPNKNQYRKFSIPNVTTSQVVTLGDVGMLKEILTRRFNHPEWPRPDLIVVDGGKAQLSAVQDVIYNFPAFANASAGRQFSISNKFSMKQFPVIAIAKNEKHIGEKIYIDCNSKIKSQNSKARLISLSKLPSEVKSLLLQINSEAHRFAISYYRKTHRSSINKNLNKYRHTHSRHQKNNQD